MRRLLLLLVPLGALSCSSHGSGDGGAARQGASGFGEMRLNVLDARKLPGGYWQERLGELYHEWEFHEDGKITFYSMIRGNPDYDPFPPRQHEGRWEFVGPDILRITGEREDGGVNEYKIVSFIKDNRRRQLVVNLADKTRTFYWTTRFPEGRRKLPKEQKGTGR
jgi:hypothetical protein